MLRTTVFSTAQLCKKEKLCIESAMVTSGIVKVLPCLLNRKKMIELYHKTLEINAYVKESSIEKKIAYKWLSLQNKLISLVIISYVFFVSTYFIYPLYRGDTFPVQGVVPKVFHKFPWIVIIYILETIGSILRLVVVVSCDVYLIIFMCQLCCELQTVGNAMSTINTLDANSIFRAIDKHKRALEYGAIICREFSSAIVIQHLGMSAGLLFAAVSILYMKEQALLVKFISAVIIFAAELLLLCFCGETIVGESLKIAEHLENVFEEFLNDIASLKTISFMLLRAQRPLSLRVGDNTIINLNLFRLTINKIFSCFVILNRAMSE